MKRFTIPIACLMPLLACGLLALATQSVQAVDDSNSVDSQPLVLVVMDPLCDKLACDCVQGYAQRKYEALGSYLQQQLGQEVKVYWGESIQAALEQSKAQPDIIVGKHSVVLAGARDLKLKLSPIAQLTGSDGSVTQTGLIVVRRDDAAHLVSDLKGYRIFFGPENCDEKFKAPMNLLKANEIPIPAKPEISAACSQAATKLMELDPDIKAAAIISSYAEPLLAGCGTIEKGDLRIIGISDEVEFVTAFINAAVPEPIRNKIQASLLASEKHPALLKSLETKNGFVPFKSIDNSGEQTEATQPADATVGGQTSGSQSTATGASKKN